MNRMVFPLLVSLLLATAAPGLAGTGIDRALRDLESPFFEARRRAVLALSRAGGEGETAMRRAYARADFRTKALILDGFVRGRPEEGLSLVFSDLATTDRGIVLAQRRLVSALYAHVRRYATEVVLPRVPVRDWQTREGIRAVPGATPRTTAALRHVAASEDALLRRYGCGLVARMGVLSEVRERLVAIAAGTDKAAGARARSLLGRLLRHDTERALLAVFEESARDGSFDGMYDIVSELVGVSDASTGNGKAGNGKAGNGKAGDDAITVLMAILTDEPIPEGGIPPDPRRKYSFLEPLPPDADPLTLRTLAASALGDVGDRATGARLVEYHGRIHWNSREEWHDDEERNQIDDLTTPKLAVAIACAALGKDEPLRERVKYLELILKNFFYGSSLDRRQLALAYARLGEFGKAAQQYRYILREMPRDAILRYNLACALARSGDDRGSLRALRTAVTNGYGADPSQIAWAYRDRDLKSVRKLAGFRELFGEPAGK